MSLTLNHPSVLKIGDEKGRILHINIISQSAFASVSTEQKYAYQNT